jgi:serine/threonine-protein kinase
VFAAADFPMDRFTPATPVWIPPDHSDRRAAWTGTLPEADDLAIRVEAAGYKDRVTWFRIIYPWTPQRDGPALAAAGPGSGSAGSESGSASGTANALVQSVTTLISDSLYQIVFLVAIVMARHNIRLKRGDRHGAFWVAPIAFAFSLAQWFVDGRYLFTGNRVYIAAALALLEGARIWIFYLALEPIVRRYWPAGMISWSRLIAGDWRDPLVGWHVLAGVACGVVLQLTLVSYRLLPAVMGDGPPPPMSEPIGALDSASVFMGTLAMTVTSGLGTALFIVFCYATGRRLLRRDIYASTAVGLFLALALAKEFITGRHLPVEIGMLLLLMAMVIVILRWFGFVAALTTFMVNQLFSFTPLTANLSDWYASTTVSTLVIIGVLTLYGYTTSRAGAPVFGRFNNDPSEA